MTPGMSISGRSAMPKLRPSSTHRPASNPPCAAGSTARPAGARPSGTSIARGERTRAGWRSSAFTGGWRSARGSASGSSSCASHSGEGLVQRADGDAGGLRQRGGPALEQHRVAAVEQPLGRQRRRVLALDVEEQRARLHAEREQEAVALGAGDTRQAQPVEPALEAPGGRPPRAVGRRRPARDLLRVPEGQVSRRGRLERLVLRDALRRER